jgi:Tfp pilus assembly protein PilX
MNKQTGYKGRFIWLLTRLYKSHLSQESGYILILVIASSLLLSALLMAYVVATKIERITSASSSDSNSGFYGAEAGLNARAEALRQEFVNFNRPAGASPTSVSACLDGSSGNDGSGSFACQSTLFSSAGPDKGANRVFSYVVQRNGGNPTQGIVPRGEPYENLNMTEYGYSVYAVAKKESAATTELTAILQLDVKSRLVPMFQFAAFYANDLEILPGPTMNLSGPVHTNGSLYLGANNNNGLNINGQVTLAGDLYNKRKNDNSTYPDGRVRIINAAGSTFLNLLYNGTGSTSQTTNYMDPVRIAAAWGTKVQLGILPVSIPSPSVLTVGGDYEQKADLRITYTPSNNLVDVPFAITAINRTTSTSTVLTEGALRSLRQPVLVSQALAGITGTYNVCTPNTSTSATTLTGLTSGALTATVRAAIANDLYQAIVAQANPLSFSSIGQSLTTAIGTTTFNTLIDNDTNLSSLTLTQKNLLKTNLAGKTLAAIAGIDGRCFVSAPLQDIGRTGGFPSFRNDREGNYIRLLQINFQNLTIWNSVGQYVLFNSGTPTPANVSSANQLLFATAAPDNGAPAGSFQRLGLAASDTTEGGLVIHATINTTTYPTAAGNTSPYGFAITQGRQLMGLAITATTTDPTGLTFASDQAVYLQGDYNTLNKQPAGILADSLNLLSNACRYGAEDVINKGSNVNCNTGSGAAKIAASDTTVNTAFLAGTDITNSALTGGYNGGLENYPRFLENWSGDTLTYRGSFVSLGIPTHVRGPWEDQAYSPPGRDWDYDIAFNNANSLPPLTPQFVYLRQEAFLRNFEK